MGLADRLEWLWWVILKVSPGLAGVMYFGLIVDLWLVSPRSGCGLFLA
ncbi:hypothetical protein [Vulcanisaeta sp. JCM 14467]|nr:hypothetical protein [Vulcanisaeta sp. JCM 14467]